MNKKRLLVIPARAGSKRIKNKNIKLFCGKPIISYPIKAAVESKLFRKIHVSTDSIKIANICKKFGANTDFLRPKKLSGDNIPLFDVIKFVRDEYKKSGQIFDEIWCILPASPLLTSNDLKIFAKRYHKKKIPMILGSPYPAPINWRFEIKKNLVKNSNLKEIRNKKLSKINFFYDSGQLYCFNNSYLDKRDFNFNDKIFIHKLPLEKSVDIDTKADWNFAKILFRGLKNLSK